MDAKQMRSEKFSEELYFMVMSSPIKDRVSALAGKYGLSRQALRDEVLSLGRGMAERIDRSVDDMGAWSLKLAV